MVKNNRNSSVERTTAKVLFKIAMLYLAAAIILTVTMGCELFTLGLGEEIDITPPVVAITSHMDGETVNGTIVLFGTMGDDISIENVTMSIETEVKTPTRNNNNWQIEIPTDSYSNGSKHICVVVTDYANKTAEASLLLNFSN